MNDRIGHLNEEQIIDSVIDGRGLKEGQKGHLETCPLCSEQKAALRSELERLGQMAAGFTPAPQKKPYIPVPEFRLFTFRRMALATGFAVALLVALLWGPAFLSDPRIQKVAEFSNEEEMVLFLVEDILEESALPGLYLDTAATSDNYLDEEFMELLIPSGEYHDSV